MTLPAGTHTRASIQTFVQDQIREMGVDAALITETARLDDLGLDSLDVVELTQVVKKELLIPVSPNDFAKAAAVADAVTVIAERAGVR